MKNQGATAARVGWARRRTLGFTLIELMVVVAIVAILAAIAYPSFQEQIRKSRRAQAKADMLQVAQLAERFHTTNNTYAGFGDSLDADLLDSSAHYQLEVTDETQAGFIIAVTPQAGQADDRCGNLTINQAGARSRSGTAPEAECW